MGNAERKNNCRRVAITIHFTMVVPAALQTAKLELLIIFLDKSNANNIHLYNSWML